MTDKVAFSNDAALFRDAEEWIMEENNDWPFFFENSCLALELNPSYVRRGLLRWRGQKIAQRQNRKTTAIFQQSHYNQHCNGGRKSAGARNVYQE